MGEKVVSFRAPAFSIDENSKWVFEMLDDFEWDGVRGAVSKIDWDGVPVVSI